MKIKTFLIGWLCLVVELVLIRSVSAEIYYVDASNGSDLNSGLTETAAWRSLQKINRSFFQPGDQILFKKGERWQGNLEPPSSGEEGNPIVFASYGTSSHSPIIAGAELLTSPQYQWLRSRTGKNEYYLTLQGGENPKWLAPSFLWRNHRLQKNETAGSLLSRGWDYADNDSLGFRTIYIRDNSGDPDTSGILLEASKDRYCLGVFNQRHLRFENINFEKSTSRIVAIEENSRSISFFDCSFRQGYGPLVHLFKAQKILFQNCRFVASHGIGPLLKMSDSSSSVQAQYCQFDDSNGYSVEIDNGQSADFTNCLFIGSNLGHIRNISSITVNAVNCIFSVPGKSRPSLTFHNDGSGRIVADHCAVMPNGHSPKQESRSEVSENNTVRMVPRFVSHKNKGIITFIMDDTPNFSRWQQVADIAERYGYRISMALFGRDMTEKDWQDAASYAARGHEIASHSRSHAYLTERDSFSIQYVGDASQALLSFDGRYLTTQLIGQSDSSRNLQIDTNDARYDTFQEISRYIGSQAGYRCDMTSQWHTRVSVSSLSKVSGMNIQQGHRMEIDKSLFFYDEIIYAKQEIENRIPHYQCKSFIYPGGDYDDEIARFVRDAGFIIARSVIPNQYFMMDDLNIMEMGALDLPTFIDLNNIELSIHAICETANYTGSLRVLFDHADLTLDQYEQIFAALRSYGDIQVMTLAQAGEYIRSRGEDLDGNGLRWSVPQTGKADYRLQDDSPLINAGFPVGLYFDMDGSSVPYGTLPDIGPYEWSTTQPLIRTPAPTPFPVLTPTPIPFDSPTPSSPTPSPTRVPILNPDNLLAKGLAGFFFQEDWPQTTHTLLSRLSNGIDMLEINMNYPAFLYADIPVMANQMYQFKTSFRSERVRRPSVYFENPTTRERISDQQTIYLGAFWQDVFAVLTAQTSLPNARLVIHDYTNTTGKVWLSQSSLKWLTSSSQEPTPSLPTVTPTPFSTSTATPTLLRTQTPTGTPTFLPTFTPIAASIDDWKELDVSGNGKIDEEDLLLFLQDWQKETGQAEHPTLDIDHDGRIACKDLLVWVYYWNRTLEENDRFSMGN